MGKYIIIILILIFLVPFFLFNNEDDSDVYSEIENSTTNKKEYLANDSYDQGYEWAENNLISNFSECDDEFGAGTNAEDGCNEYVQESTPYNNSTFSEYECTEDCSGHEAGYEWAEENGIEDLDDCDGYSDSFIEGCWAYVEENY